MCVSRPQGPDRLAAALRPPAQAAERREPGRAAGGRRWPGCSEPRGPGLLETRWKVQTWGISVLGMQRVGAGGVGCGSKQGMQHRNGVLGGGQAEPPSLRAGRSELQE